MNRRGPCNPMPQERKAGEDFMRQENRSPTVASVYIAEKLRHGAGRGDII